MSSRPVPRVGVFGGSFNPIHFGHLLVADEIVEALDLDRLLLVPAALPPHKPDGDLAPARARFEMTALAVREHERFEVCDLELRRPGPSYTVDTLEALRGRGELHLVIGSETFLDLLSWKEPSRVARLARLVVVPRIGTGFDPEAPAAQKVLAELGCPALLRCAPGEGPRPRGRCSSRRRRCPSPPPRSGGGHGRAGASPTGCPTASSAISASTICIVRSTDERAERRDRRPGGRPRGARKECARRGRARPAGTLGDRRLLPRLQRAIDDAGRHDHRRRARRPARRGRARHATARAARRAAGSCSTMATSSSTCFSRRRARSTRSIGSGATRPCSSSKADRVRGLKLRGGHGSLRV